MRAAPSGPASMFAAALVSLVPLSSLLGEVLHVAAPLSGRPQYAAMSPLTALALLLIASSIVSTALASDRTGGVLAGVALGVAGVPLFSTLVYGGDLASPAVIEWMHAPSTPTARMSPGSGLSITAVALALLPPMRRRRRIPDILCGIAVLIAGTSLLACAYGTLDLYGTMLFKTMAPASAATILGLALAAISLHAANGWFALLTAANEAGAATRRQLLLALGGPALGWAVLRLSRDAHLGVGASLAISVTLTTVPLAWLILRDGRLLNELGAAQQAQREAAAAHTRDVERQLTRLAQQMEQQTAEKMLLVQEAKIHSDNRYRVLFQSIDDGFCIIETKFDAGGNPVDYQYLETNEAFESMTGLRQAQGRWMRGPAPWAAPHWFDLCAEIARNRVAKRFESHDDRVEGRWYEIHAFPVDEPHLNRVGILFHDISERRLASEALQQTNLTLEERVARAVAEREHAQAALRQSQKMEAVGQLTGGLAHDFNNLLQGISGSLELVHSRITQGRLEEVERYVAAAQGAARRASSLTHRLLAFSRRQTLEPKPIDMNRVVAGMEDLIRRTVGPHIAVENIAAGGLWNTLADQGQLENALLNLCINARDAMPDGGRLVIETGNKWLDERAAQERDVAPGQYVALCVSDDGCGMPPEIIERAFDPFFTTKPLGTGTGLGLSMIYGFAKQSGGQVRIYSEVGKGAMVCLWLPRYFGASLEEEMPPVLQSPPKRAHRETVLVVDDEPTIRMLIKEVLEELGLASIEAGDGPSALKILQSEERVDLLITDVGLPGGMNGRQVADAARNAQPDLTVLFITGYAENAVLSHGHLPVGMHVLTKPFAMETIANRIQDLIA